MQPLPRLDSLVPGPLVKPAASRAHGRAPARDPRTFLTFVRIRTLLRLPPLVCAIAGKRARRPPRYEESTTSVFAGEYRYGTWVCASAGVGGIAGARRFRVGLVADGAGARARRRRRRRIPPQMTFPGWGVNPADLDPSIKPGDDFDAYVNGKWKAATADPGQISLLRGHHQPSHRRRARGQARSSTISRPGRTRRAASSRGWRTCTGPILDVEAINRAGLAPARPYLDRIAAVKSHDELAALWAVDRLSGADRRGHQHRSAAIPKRNIVFFGIGGLGLPDRDNYLVDNPRNLEMRAKYLDYLAFLLGKAGHASPRPAAESVYALEKKMAAAMWDRALSRNPRAHHQPDVSHAELVALARPFPLQRYLAGARILRRPTASTSSSPADAREKIAAAEPHARAARQARHRPSGDDEPDHGDPGRHLEGVDDRPAPLGQRRRSCRATSTTPISLSTASISRAASASATAGSAPSPRSRAASARRSARSMSSAISRRRARRRWRSWSATCASP